MKGFLMKAVCVVCSRKLDFDELVGEAGMWFCEEDAW
jgi:hypothetical protein